MPAVYSLFRSRISILAACSVVLLAAAGVSRVMSLANADIEPSYVAASETAPSEPQDAEYQQALMLLGLATSSDPSAVSERDPIELITPVVVSQLVGHYEGLIDTGRFNEASAAAAAESISENIRAVVPHKTYAAADIRKTVDTSQNRMLVYRTDMQEAMQPLLENTRPEFEIYGEYVETGDVAILDELKTVAARYQAAALNGAALVVPSDAVEYHRDILNALEQFAATLLALAKHADDPLASVALLRTYNAAEQNVFYSFDALTDYYKSKTL